MSIGGIAYTPTIAGGKTLAVTSTTGSVTLDTEGDIVWICNVGADDVFVELGPTAVAVVADTGHCIPTDREVFLRRNPDLDTDLAAICAATETATIKISTGWLG